MMMDKETIIKNRVKELYFDSIWAIRHARTEENFLWKMIDEFDSILDDVHPGDLRVWVAEEVNNCETIEWEKDLEDYKEVDDHTKGIHCS